MFIRRNKSFLEPNEMMQRIL